MAILYVFCLFVNIQPEKVDPNYLEIDHLVTNFTKSRFLFLVFVLSLMKYDKPKKNLGHFYTWYVLSAKKTKKNQFFWLGSIIFRLLSWFDYHHHHKNHRTKSFEPFDSEIRFQNRIWSRSHINKKKNIKNNNKKNWYSICFYLYIYSIYNGKEEEDKRKNSFKTSKRNERNKKKKF